VFSSIRIALLFFVLILSGCTTINTESSLPKPPMEKWFWSIYEEKFEDGWYDCTNKSAKYATLLRRNGYEADVWIFKVNLLKESYHAVVSVKFKSGKVVFYDVTWARWSDDLNDFIEPPAFIVPYNDMNDPEKHYSEGFEFINRGTVDINSEEPHAR
jgi:hypothetical protein